MEYNGWKNRETWNVALWLGNEYSLYCVAQGFKKYATPYKSLRNELRDSLNYTTTKDGVSLWDKNLDIPAIDEMLREE